VSFDYLEGGEAVSHGCHVLGHPKPCRSSFCEEKEREHAAVRAPLEARIVKLEAELSDQAARLTARSLRIRVALEALVACVSGTAPLSWAASGDLESASAWERNVLDRAGAPLDVRADLESASAWERNVLDRIRAAHASFEPTSDDEISHRQCAAVTSDGKVCRLETHLGVHIADDGFGGSVWWV